MNISATELRRLIKEEIEKVSEAQGSLGSGATPTDISLNQQYYKAMRDASFLMELDKLFAKVGLYVSNPKTLIGSIISSNGVAPRLNSYGAEMATPKPPKKP